MTRTKGSSRVPFNRAGLEITLYPLVHETQFAVYLTRGVDGARVRSHVCSGYLGVRASDLAGLPAAACAELLLRRLAVAESLSGATAGTGPGLYLDPQESPVAGAPEGATGGACGGQLRLDLPC